MSHVIESEPSLTIEGLVGRPGRRSLAELRAAARPDPGGPWVAVGDLLADAYSAASHVTVIAEGDAYRASIPILDLAGKGRLVVGDPDSAAGAFRLQVPGGATLCWNVKRVATLRLTDGPEPDDVPDNPTH